MAKDLQAQLVDLRSEMTKRSPAFERMLPSHMTVDRFFGIMERACMNNPDLLAADQLSFWEAALQAAEDGLPPDGKRGAMVVYHTKVNRPNEPEKKILKVQWLPMIRGVIEKLHNTGKVKSCLAHPVYKNDTYRAWIDDDGEHIQYEEHKGDRGPLISYFAAVFLHDGSRYIETMTPDDVDKVKRASKTAQRGPWVDWPEEMGKKTIFKRLAKRLPMSIEIERMMSRDDEFFLNSLRDVTPSEEARRPKGIAARMDALADNRGVGAVDVSDRQGEKQPASRQQEQPRQEAKKQEPETIPMDEEGAYEKGVADKAAGKVQRAMPADYRQKGNESLMNAWLAGFKGEDFNPTGDD